MRDEERAFHERAERLATEFRARYGVAMAWSDEKIDEALADNGLPVMASLPSGPQGIMAERHPPLGPLDAVEAHRWQRMNAMHLLGHAMLEHPGGRCDSCLTWGEVVTS